MDTRKYIFVNGVMKKNPNYKDAQQPASTVSDSAKALAIVSSTNDIAAATEAQESATGQPMQLASTTIQSMEKMQDPTFVNAFNNKKIDGGDLLEGLTTLFAKYEIPVGLINKLFALTEYDRLNFIIDDSGSMSGVSDTLLKLATPFVLNKARSSAIKMTRWQEAEDRLHIMMDILSFLPIRNITISFLNRSDKLQLTHSGKTPEQFMDEAHKSIDGLFRRGGPDGRTPLYSRLKEAFSSLDKTMHYVFTDGEPSDASKDQVGALVKNRFNPGNCPLTFISCTNDESEAQWMKDIGEVAPFTSEIDDFDSERKEVYQDQGPVFPFSRGFWLLCQLCAAINPTDLDALDESTPFTKKTMDELMGRKLTIEEYGQYFSNNPNARKFANLYQQFAREDLIAKQIVNVPGQPQPAVTYPQQGGYPPQMAAAYPATAPQQYNYYGQGAPTMYAQQPAQRPAQPQPGMQPSYPPPQY